MVQKILKKRSLKNGGDEITKRLAVIRIAGAAIFPKTINVIPEKKAAANIQIQLTVYIRKFLFFLPLYAFHSFSYIALSCVQPLCLL